MSIFYYSLCLYDWVPLLSYQVFPDNAAGREIASLPARCLNQGCNWTGSIKQYEVRCNIQFMCPYSFRFECSAQPCPSHSKQSVSLPHQKPVPYYYYYFNQYPHVDILNSSVFFPLKPSALIMSEQCGHIECTAAQAAEKQEVKPGKSLRYPLYQQQVSRKVPGYKRAVKPRLALDCSWKVTRPWHNEAAFLVYGFYSVHKGAPQLTLVFRHKTEAGFRRMNHVFHTGSILCCHVSPIRIAKPVCALVFEWSSFACEFCLTSKYGCVGWVSFFLLLILCKGCLWRLSSVCGLTDDNLVQIRQIRRKC